MEKVGIEVRVDGEHETGTGWLCTMTIVWPDAVATDHEVGLSWVDHEHLVGGMVSPSRVVEVAARLAAVQMGREAMPTRCDVSSLRRLIDGFDELVRSEN